MGKQNRTLMNKTS